MLRHWDCDFRYVVKRGPIKKVTFGQRLSKGREMP